MDLKEFFLALKDKPRGVRPYLSHGDRMALVGRLRYFPKPTIAMVNGYCFGGAFTVVEACDLAFAPRKRRSGCRKSISKIIPGGSVSKSLANMFRPRDALFYAMTGRTFNGDRAAEIGFINAAYPAADLKREIMAIAQEIAQKDPDALQACKEGYRFSLEMSAEAALNFAAAKSDQLSMRQKDSWRSEGIGDFLQGKYRPGLGGHEKTTA